MLPLFHHRSLFLLSQFHITQIRFQHGDHKSCDRNSVGDMSPMRSIDSFLHGVLQQYDKHIYLSGAYDKDGQYQQPSLANDILPMFSRWATGPGQKHTAHVLPILRPALRLASRLLMDNYCLTWFTHLTFGERRIDACGSYIKANPHSTTPEAISAVKRNIRQVGKVITFMFEPGGYEIPAYGSCTAKKSHRDFYNDFHKTDWPRVSSSDDTGHARPCVVMQRAFLRFLRDRYSSASQDETYRVLILFAITLVHEFAHAYNFWLTPEYAQGEEPRWCQEDKEAELGWSWERSIIGYGLNEFRLQSDDKGRFRHLYQVKILEYHSSAERAAAFQSLAGSNRTDQPFTKCDARGIKTRPLLLDGNEFKHSKTWFENSRKASHFFAAIQTIPMDWIVAWFNEAEWKHREAYWAEKGFYVRPSLHNSFMVLYERSGNNASTMRPINPTISADREIMRRRAQGLTDC